MLHGFSPTVHFSFILFLQERDERLLSRLKETVSPPVVSTKWEVREEKGREGKERRGEGREGGRIEEGERWEVLQFECLLQNSC